MKIDDIMYDIENNTKRNKQKLSKMQIEIIRNVLYLHKQNVVKYDMVKLYTEKIDKWFLDSIKWLFRIETKKYDTWLNIFKLYRKTGKKKIWEFTIKM